MNEYQILLEHFRVGAKNCRREAETQTAMAEIYEDCAYELEDAIEKSRQEKEKREVAGDGPTTT